MTIPRWRLGLMVGALVVLGTIGGGLVQAASAPSAPAVATTGPAIAHAPGEPGADAAPLGERRRALRDRLGDGGLGRFGRNLVHGTITVLDKDGKLVTHQLDRGTIAEIGDGSITIAEAGGTSVTVATTADTRVRKDRKPAALADLAVGDEVMVHSIVEGGAATARGIVVPAPRPAAGPAGALGPDGT